MSIACPVSLHYFLVSEGYMDEYKVCYLCNESKLVTEFYINKIIYNKPMKHKNGKLWCSSYCKKCTALRYKGYYAKI